MITILIPTYNRPPNYLKRILSYYSDYETPHNIIIADSSSNETKKLNEETISSFPNLTIQHLVHYSPRIYPYQKIPDALNYVKTKYCVVCADDDFITPNGINQSVDFLERNPDFTFAHGYHIAFYLKTGKRGKQQFYWSPGYPPVSITFPDAKSRLAFHLSNYLTPTFYAVHRTDFMKMIFEETSRFTNDVWFSELLPSMLALIYGKMKCLDVLFNAREYSPNSSIASTSKNLRDFIREGTYNEKYAKFRDCLSIHLSKVSQLDIEESKKLVDDAMSAYMKKYYSGHILINKIRDILHYLGLPDWLDSRIKRLYIKLISSRHIKATMSSTDMSPSSKYSKYCDDFNKIRLHVLSCSKKR